MLFCNIVIFCCYADKKYLPQVFLKESKYAIKKKKIMNTINEELKLDESHDDKYDAKYIYPLECWDYILIFFQKFCRFHNVYYALVIHY